MTGRFQYVLDQNPQGSTTIAVGATCGIRSNTDKNPERVQ